MERDDDVNLAGIVVHANGRTESETIMQSTSDRMPKAIAVLKNRQRWLKMTMDVYNKDPEPFAVARQVKAAEEKPIYTHVARIPHMHTHACAHSIGTHAHARMSLARKLVHAPPLGAARSAAALAAPLADQLRRREGAGGRAGG